MAPEAPMIVAVDIPIGLPDHIDPGGRGLERVIRPLLGARQSSVFSMPPRAAIYASDFGAACVAALVASNPPRKVSNLSDGGSNAGYRAPGGTSSAYRPSRRSNRAE